MFDMKFKILIPIEIIGEIISAIAVFKQTIIMNKNPKITIGPMSKLKTKFDIKKYGLTVFKLYRIIGNIAIWTEIETEIISFILSKYF